jgi:hypothetical protein
MKLALPSSDTEDVHYDHARPYRRLLTAVITMSVRDASTPPTKGERRAGRNRLTDSRQALRWLFAPNPVLDWYCNHLGMDAADVREGLRMAMYSDRDGEHYGAEDRRILRVRYHWAREERMLDEPYDVHVETAVDFERRGDGDERS